MRGSPGQTVASSGQDRAKWALWVTPPFLPALPSAFPAVRPFPPQLWKWASEILHKTFSLLKKHVVDASTFL